MLNQDGILLNLPGDYVDPNLPTHLRSLPIINSRVQKRIEISQSQSSLWLDIYQNGTIVLLFEDQSTPILAISYSDNFIYCDEDYFGGATDALSIILALSRYINRYNSDDGDLGITNINQAIAAVERLRLTQKALDQASERNQELIQSNLELVEELEKLKEELKARREEDGIYEIVDSDDEIELELFDDEVVQDTQKGDGDVPSEKRKVTSDDFLRILFTLRDSESDRTD
jgi:hypothetical protein